MLDEFFDQWEGVSIQTDEDYRKPGEFFDEKELLTNRSNAIAANRTDKV
jgi:hypothetical protein